MLPVFTPQPYTEPLRPQFHFTARKGWLNDPNGLVYFKGQYHLFFQHNPFGTQWGNMTWGHAISKDLIHWTQLPEAIEPDGLGTIFSGSAVVDLEGTAGFGKGALVCMYTAAGGTNDASKGKSFTQCLAYSTDGLHFNKYSGNPVMPHIEAENRDPKLIWLPSQKEWVLALFLDGNRYALFSSPSLKEWTRICAVDMPNAGECPDFFELPIDGDRNHKKWVFWGASGYYRVGSFDGKAFMPESESIRTNFGNTGYASQTYFNDPKGRRVQLSWFNGAEFPGCAWNQQMGIPNELQLVSTAGGPRLKISPVREVESLRGPELHETDGWYSCPSGLMDIICDFSVPPSGKIIFIVNGTSISFDAASQSLTALGKEAHLAPVHGKVRLRLLSDRASIEVYGNGGIVYMPLYSLPANGRSGLEVVHSGNWHPRITAYEMDSAWN